MNRLTKKMNHYCDTDIDFDYKFADEDVCVGEIVDKLGQLEDLEEELGCPLEEIVEFIRLLKKTYYINNVTGRLDERWSPSKSNEKELCKINSIFYKIKDKSE